MTNFKNRIFLSGLNFQRDNRNTFRSDRFPKVGVLIVAFILSFIGSFKTIARVDNYSKITASKVASVSMMQDVPHPEVLAADVQGQESSIESVEVNTLTITVTPSIDTTPVTTIPTVTPTPSLASSPTPSPVPQPIYSESEVMGFIDRFAGQYGLDPNVMRHIATCESGFNQHAQNGPYVGLFQFGTSAWVTGRAKMGEDANLDLRLNAEESIQTAAYLLADGRTDLWPSCMP